MSEGSLRLDLDLAMRRLREGADDHFYGSWFGGAKAAGGHSASGVAAKIKEKDAAFRDQDGVVDTSGRWSSDEVEGQLLDLMEQGIMGPNETGVVFTKSALESQMYRVAGEKQHGIVAGAIGYNVMNNGHSDIGRATWLPANGNHLHIDYLGTTGIVDGTGSALVRKVVKEAAAANLPIGLYAVERAVPFWRAMGMRPVPDSIPGMMGMPASEVAALAALL